MKLRQLFLLLFCVCFCTIATAQIQDKLLLHIQALLSRDPITNPLRLTIINQGGIISLEGVVSFQEEAIRAIEIVMSTPGVVDINVNKLLVAQPKPSLGDEVISAKVRGTYVRLQIFGSEVKDTTDLPIEVRTNNGITFLLGFVANRAQLAALINTARRVSGVQRVISELVIRATTESTT